MVQSLWKIEWPILKQFKTEPPLLLSHWVVSDTLRPQGLLCLLLSQVCSDSCSLSWWRYPTISSSAVPFFFCLPSFAAWGSFPMKQLFASGGQRTGASASASALLTNIQDWFPLLNDWLDLLAVQGTLKSLVQHHSTKASILWCSAFFMVQFSYSYMSTGKTIAVTKRTFVGKVMSLLFNMLSTFVIAFLPRSKGLLISWLQSSSAVILEPKKIKSTTVSIFFSPIYLPWSDGTEFHDLSFLNIEL